MSSETITREDLKGILNSVLPISNQIKTKTVTGTTNGNGALNLSLQETANIIYIKSTSSDHYAMPFMYSDSTWYAKVVNWRTFANIANTSVTLTVKYYME